jgi:hypothetical protein
MEGAAMALLPAESTRAEINPLDVMEELVNANEWRYDRSTDQEMIVEFTGQWCDYRMFFVWQEDLGAMYYSCLFDMRISPNRRRDVTDLLALVNERLWLGHFDLCSEEMAPMFRHTILLRGTPGIAVEQLEDLVEAALSECERFYPAFQFVVWGGKKPQEALEAALLETVGEA